MPILDANDRADITAQIQREADCPGGLSKAQLRAVYNALDAWWEATGAAAGNAAIPQPQRGILTGKQKAAIFMSLLRRKYERT